MAKWCKFATKVEMPQLRNLTTLALSIMSLFFSVAFALTPPDFSRSEILWKPNSSEKGGVFELTRGWPETLAATTTCSNLRDSTPGLVLDTGGLRLFSAIDSLLLEVGSAPGKLEVILPTTGDCQVEIGFSGKKAKAYISVDGKAEFLKLGQESFPKVTQLKTSVDRPSTIQEVRIITRPTGIDDVRMRAILGMYSILFAIGAMLLSAGIKKSNKKEFVKKKSRIHIADAIVVPFVFIAAILIPPAEDDGWVLARVDAFKGRGVFGNYYWNSDAWLPQGYSNELVFSLLRGLGLDFIHLRIFVALIVIATWLVLRRGVIEPLVGREKSIVFPAAGMFISFACVYLITLRSEPFVALFVGITFAALVNYCVTKSSLALGIGTFAAGMSLSLHQTGIMAVVPWLVMLSFALRMSTSSQNYRSNQLVAIIIGISTSILIMFLPFDANTLIGSLNDFHSSDSHSGGIFAEISRFRLLLNVASPYFFPVAILVIVIFLGSYRIGNMNSNQRVLWITALSSMSALLLTGSKWVWHLGVYAVPATVLIALLMSKNSDFRRRLDGNHLYVLLLPMALYLMGTLLEQFGTWGVLSQGSQDWQEFVVAIKPSTQYLLWLLLIAAFAFFGFVVDKRVENRTLQQCAAILITSLLVLPIAINMVFLQKESRNDLIWSAAQQNWLDLTDVKTECGALSSSNFISSARSMPIEGKVVTINNELSLGAHPALPGIFEAPFDGMPTWGSWFSKTETTNIPANESPNDHNNGQFVTPNFTLGSDATIGVWTSRGGNTSQSSEIVFLAIDGSVLARIPLLFSTQAPPFDLAWHLNKVDVPKQAVSTYIQIDDSSTAIGGWSAVTSPSKITEISSSETFYEKSSFTGPFERTMFPCLELKSPTEGYWPEVELVTANASTWEARKYVDFTLTQIGCANRNSACVYKVTYPTAKVEVVSTSE
jgi:hypothetical protein